MPGRKPPPPKAKAPTRAPRRDRNSLPAKHTRSRLAQSFTPSDVSDTESVAESVAKSVASEESTASYDSAVAATGEDGCPFWTRAEMASRKKLPVEWKEMMNGACYRKAFLSFLGEDRLPPAMLQHIVRAPVDRCCSCCNPLLVPELTLPLQLRRRFVDHGPVRSPPLR